MAQTYVRTGDVARETVYEWICDKNKLMSAAHFLIEANKSAVESDTSGQLFLRFLTFAMDAGGDGMQNALALARFTLFRFPKETQSKINDLALCINEVFLDINKHASGERLEMIDAEYFKFSDDVEDETQRIEKARTEAEAASKGKAQS